MSNEVDESSRITMYLVGSERISDSTMESHPEPEVSEPEMHSSAKSDSSPMYVSLVSPSSPRSVGPP